MTTVKVTIPQVEVIKVTDGVVIPTPNFSGIGTNGLVPDPGTGTGTRVLRSDGGWGEPGGGSDPDAVHVNVAGEIAGVALKASPVPADLVIIEDSEASNAKKRVQVGDIMGGGGGGGDVTGPAGATDERVARYDGTTGKLLQQSAVGIDDSGNVTTPGTVDGRDLSTDGAKLDGIESGATADQVAADVPFTPAGGVSASDVQAAIEELDSEKLEGPVLNAELADMAQDRLKGRVSSGSGSPEDLTAAQVRALLGVEAGANAYSHPDHTGDVTSSGDGAQTIADNAVTNAKAADMAASTLKGRASGAGIGDPTDLTAAQVRAILNVADGANAYSHPNHTGDVTSTGDGATTIAANAVDFTKMVDINEARIMGRQTGVGSGDPQAMIPSQAKAVLSIQTSDVTADAEFDMKANTLGFDLTSYSPVATPQTIDWRNGNKQKVSLSLASTTLSFTAPTNVCGLTLIIEQDATGGRDIVWPASIKWAGGNEPNIGGGVADQVDIVTFIYDGTDYYGALLSDFS